MQKSINMTANDSRYTDEAYNSEFAKYSNLFHSFSNG